jgi:hypothetical protein
MATPKIDHQYWFDLSKSLADNSGTIRNEAAAKLQTMVAWFWTVYTGAVTISAVATKLLPGRVLGWLAAPSALLILAYWMTVRAQMPADMTFDPRSPDDIRRAFNKGMAKKRWALWWALLFSLIAATVLGIALYLLGTQKERKPAVPSAPIIADFTASQHVLRQPFIRITGVIPDADTARIVVTSVDPKPKRSVVVLAPVAQNRLASNVPMAEEMKKYQVSIGWTPRDKSERSIVKSF